MRLLHKQWKRKKNDKKPIWHSIFMFFPVFWASTHSMKMNGTWAHGMGLKMEKHNRHCHHCSMAESREAMAQASLSSLVSSLLSLILLCFSLASSSLYRCISFKCHHLCYSICIFFLFWSISVQLNCHDRVMIYLFSNVCVCVRESRKEDQQPTDGVHQVDIICNYVNPRSLRGYFFIR